MLQGPVLKGDKTPRLQMPVVKGEHDGRGHDRDTRVLGMNWHRSAESADSAFQRRIMT